MPRIILIGGPPRCGKSTLAKKLALHFSIPWISTGVLGGIARKYIPEEKDAEMFPKNVMRKETGGGNDKMYATYTPQEIVDAYATQAATVSDAIKTFVDFAQSDNWDYILEGYYITPRVIKEITDAGFEIQSLILVNTNPDEIIARCTSSDASKDWVRDKTKEKETYAKIAEMITLYSKQFIEDAKECDVKYIDTGVDFQKQFNEAFEYLAK